MCWVGRIEAWMDGVWSGERDYAKLRGMEYCDDVYIPEWGVAQLKERGLAMMKGGCPRYI